MSSSVLHARSEDMDTAEKRGKYTVSVIGCGQVGVLHTYLFAEAGFKVICVDADQTIVNLLAKGKAPFLGYEIESKLKTWAKTGQLNATSETKNAVSKSDVIVIAIPVNVDAKKKTDYSIMENACKQVGSSLRRGSLVIVVSIVGFGFTEGRIREILENNSGFKVEIDFGLAYSPIPMLNTQSLGSLMNYERVIAAPEKTTLNSASVILGNVSKKEIKKTENIKNAEVAALFEAVQGNVNVSLANEIAFFCEKAGLDYLEVRKLSSNRAYDALPFPTLATTTQKEAYILLEDAENLGTKLRIVTLGEKINSEMIKHAISLTHSGLKDCRKTLRRARIAILGIGRVANIKSPPRTAAKELATMLKAKGAKVSLHDPHFSDKELTDISFPFKKNLTEAVEGVDCIIILTGHDQFKHLNLKKIKMVMKIPAAIVDLAGIAEADKVEKEGFVYRGLGRGVWKK